MKRRTREEKAITLIALIITMIVLLILAVVAINAVTGDGIIQHATNAKTEYEKAQEEENSMISYYQTYLDAEGQVGKWVQSNNSIKKVNSDGSVDEIKIGEVVAYEKADGTQYTDTNGNNITWKVLGAEKGKILLVSADNMCDYTVLLNEMYIKGEEDLNNLCNAYKNEETADLARSINIDDVNRVTGYNPETIANGEEGTIGTYGNVITYTASSDGVTFTATKSAGGAVTENNVNLTYINYIENDEWKTLEGSGTKTITTQGYTYWGATTPTGYETYKGMNMDTQSEAYKLIFRDSTNENYAGYWLASKLCYAKSRTTDKGITNIPLYGLRLVNKGGIGAYGYSGVSTETGGKGVRVVIQLKSDIELEKVNGVWNFKSE